jgi:transposase-like protein
MHTSESVCPTCGGDATRKDGRDRKGVWVHRCGTCRRRFTALAVRWYLRFRLSYADVAGLLVERGITAASSTIFAGVREFAPIYEDAARLFRHCVGGTWSVDET